MSAKSSRASLDTLGTCGTHRPASRHPSRNAPLAGSVASAAGINLRQLALFTLIVILGYQSVILVNANDIDNDLIFDESDDAEDSTSDKDFMNENAVSPVSSPILQIFDEKHLKLNGKNVSKSVSKKGDNLLQATEEDYPSDPNQVDDEDYLEGEASGISDGGSATELEPDTEPPPPVQPTDELPDFYRITFYFPSLPYTEGYSSRQTPEWQSLNRQLINKVEPLFSEIQGEHWVTLLTVEPHLSGCRVMIDVGSRDSHPEEQYKNIIMRELQKGQIAGYRVDPTDFNFKPVKAAKPPPFGTLPPCKETEFTCGSNECIDKSKHCDQTTDCVDGSDEVDCATKRPSGCRSDDQHVCKDGSCIDSARLCDGTRDCPLGDDEDDCDDTTTPLVCHPDYHFMCDQFECVELNKKCDGIPDCSNGADEQNCPKLEPDVGGQRCSAGEFQCHSGQCVEGYRRCDSMRDCPNGEDELDCNFTCGEGQWQCRSKTCIDAHQRCDNHYDCPDYSDEENCTRPNTSCAAGQFQCNDNVTCIDQQYRCDRRYDCPDYSDEYDCDKCTPLQFRCGDGTCIDLRLKCNRQPDCIDYSDERDCVNCTTEQFRCGDDFCIDVKFRCDGQADCRDNSDEQDCPCRSDQFQCRNGVCIDSRRRCDRYPDCGDGSDESNCPGECASNEIRCHDGSCIHIDLRCNGYNDCNDGYDEEGCPTCSSTQFRCNDGTCIENSKHCNYEYDCPDFSDEVNCSTTGPPFPCGPNHVECEDGSCVPDSKKCDGRLDCIDGKDERDCVEKCTAGQFRCDGTCLDNSYRCDGRRDCSDYSDELNCTDAIRPCHTGQFQCQDRSCIDLGLKCDNHRDCPDGSDEVDCVRCPYGQFHCGDRTCINSRCRCNGYPDCRDGSDELNCECTSLQFRCPDGSCIDIRRKCDGRNDCLDGFDESNCFRCRQGEFQCGDGTCIPAAQHCDGRYDCRDLSDETRTCDAPCRSDQFKCTSGECISSYFHCDRKYDCRDNSDELNCPLIQSLCGHHKFPCDNGECIDENLQCNNHYDCSDFSDEQNCDCTEYEFRCQSGECIDVRRHCDGSIDCSDRSDEIDCPAACGLHHYQCDSGYCIKRAFRCDGKFDCPDYSDELDCHWRPCGFGEFRCENGPCISDDARCDGRFDCPDTSDELDCPLQGNISITTYPNSQVIEQGREVVFQCRDEGTQRAPVKWNRAGGYPLPPNSTDVHGRLTMPNIQLHHSGSYICSVAGVLASAEHSKWANLTVVPFVYPTARPLGVCSREEATCQNGQCIIREYVCDSDFDCEDGSDELNCRRTQSVCEPTDFQCENKKCIRKIWRCDGENDCGDNSDESLCATLEPGHCEYKEIKCGNTDQCVPKSFQCDGEMDCQDGSDEIGCRPPTVIQPPPETIMVTVGETVTITCIAIGTPVPLISWRRNWGHIPPQPRVTTTSEDGHGVITIRNAQESDSGAYSCEATNSKESVLARPDAQLIVKPLAGVCQPPYFNINGKSLADCLQCFCFGHTNDCFSSGLYITQLPHGTVISVIAVSTTSSGSYIFNDQRYTLNQDLILHLPQAQEFRIDERFYRSAASNVIYYWNLPAPFLQNKLTSYGGYLHYSINYRSRPNSTPVFAPDVVVKGNSLTLYARGQPVQEGVSVESAIQFWEGTWFRLSPGSRGDGSDPLATRQDIMQVLQNLEAIWIRASYVYEFGETSLISLKMDTASSVDDGHGRAVFVEQCTCPPGYEGLSCESCASGYSRLSTGRYLGECRRTSCECHGHSESCDSAGNCYNCQHNTEGSRCEKCQDGYYGDPQSGSICQPCPCPLTILSNQFSSTCFLDVDGEPTCSACPREYVGRQCQSCAPGYHGDPNIPGQSCTTAVSPCDPIGSYLPQPDPRTGLCQCKDYVTGPTCSQCQHDKFYLNEHTLGGCLNCFCMGIIPTCRSSQLFRSTESVIFANDRAGFAITDLDLSHTEEQSIRVNSVSHQIYFREFNRLSPGRMYYWKLPQNFLGNKLTSYGGNLTYTVHYSAAFSGRQSPGFDVQIMGNRITLGYRHFYQPQQQTTTTISVPLFERYWKRSDGQPATREHLMMALAKLNTILIKAMYSDQMLETSIKDVSLETTVAYNNGQRQAIEVEQCRCPIGYKGTSCEECDSGYTRSSGGLYLGLCEPCFCNGHSRDCDPDTGLCRNCQNNTTGNFCEQCLPGYHGNATERTSGCIFSPISTCSCDKKGTLENSCDTTGLCTCKTNVVGDNCNQCKPGFFNLEERNPEGCSKCFCFGHSFDCTSSSYFRSQIRPLLSDSRNHGFVITDRYQSSHSEDGIWINENTNEIGFRPSQFHDVHGRSFFSLPSLFTGNRLNSYGGKLQFFIKYTANRNGQPLKDSDVIITGNNMSLHYINHSFYLQPDSLQRFEVELTEAHWQLTDPRFRGSLTRENFMSVLANIQGLLIRASQHESMTEVVLSDVQMDSAVPQYNGQVLAHAVEICQCPPGYIGHSCEECAPGYIREHNMEGPVGRCLPCNCHRHSDYCEPNTRQCQSCQHNTMGPNCERCAEGYYGDATVGTPDDCQPCPCPLTISSNQFTRTCYLDSDGQPTCHGCPAGYSGRNCDECSAGYTGNPRQAGDSCKLITGPSSIIHVQIREPKYQQASEGDTVTFVCVGYSQVRDRGMKGRTQPGTGSRRKQSFTYNVVWTREDGRPLSHYSHEAAGTLTIQGVRSEDSGTYICTGSDIHGVATDRAVLRVGLPTVAPSVHIEPRTQDITIGEPVEFWCSASGIPRPTIQWTRGHNFTLNPFGVVLQEGVLRILSVSRSDAGDYYCSAVNFLGNDRGRAVLLVHEDKTPGRIHVNIVPHSYEARPDETVRFDCRVEGAISATTSWSKAGQSLPSGAVQVGNMLILQSVDESYRGIYICTVVTPEGSSTAQSTLNIVQETGRPTAVIEPEQQTVPQGSEAEIRCIVSGEPAPKIEWQKAGEQLPTSHQIVGNTLRIHNVAISDRGVYVCSAENGFGFAQASGILEVERREPPAIEIYPSTIETIPQSASAMFQCRIMAGAPSPTVEWTRKDGHSLPRNAEVLSGGVIRFMHVTGEEQGRYVCTARNTAGSATAVVSLIIEGLPEITISPPSPYTVEVGQTVHLVCRAMGDPSTTVSWQFPSQRSFISEPRYREIDRAPSTATLEISNVQQEDEGYYSCKALNQVGYSEERLHLIVNQGYVPTHPSPREFVVQEGARAELRCSTYGTDSSQYSIQWVRSNGRPMPSNHTVTRSGVLTIDNVHKQDAGDYSCLGVVNGTIRFSVITTVVVLAPPRLNVSPVTMTARPGERVMFRCHATGDEPIHINWKKVSGSLSHSAIIQGGDLIFQNVGMEDAGRYVCTARNHIGEAEGVVEVYINEFGCRPDSQCLDDGCISDCSGPAPSDDQTQQLGCDNLLEGACDEACPTNLFRCHDGINCVDPRRRCDRHYDCPDRSDEINCDVPYISVPQKNQTVYVGSTVDLVCEAHGHPPPSIVWSRDREALPIHSQIEGNILRITKVLVEDGGKYICTASNEAGISSDFTFLNVQVGPPCTTPHYFLSNVFCCIQSYRICDGVADCAHGADEVDCQHYTRNRRGISQVAVHIEPSLSHVRTGDNLTVRCAAVGDPSATTSWSKVDGPLLHNTRIFGDTLHIENVETLNGGVYRCTVSTFTGNYQEDYVLNIQNIASLTQNTQVETKTAPLGTNVVMECRANLNQPASYIWSKQDGMLSPYATIEGSILRIADVRMSDAGTYICTARDLRRKLEIPTVLTVTGVVPYFAQAPVSYMLLPTLPDAYLIFDIELSFKPESHDGLILYNGQHSDGSGDFISFGLSRGYAEFRFDVGSGPAILRSVMPLEIGKWHTVKLHRNRKDGAMNIQGQQIVNGSAGGMFQGLDLSKPFYVGGVSDFSSVHHLSGFNRSFVGCISRLIIGGVVHDLSHDSSTKYGVTTCETCALNPCTNAGVCQEALTYTGYRCICPAGFSGVNCETVGESCYPGLCGMGRCVDLPTGFQCYCPYGKAGRHCEKDITIYEPAFRDDAYVAYPTPKTMKKHKFLLKFKPRSLNDGLLMYCARTESGQGDFISLTVKDKKVEFRFDTGSGPAILQSNNNLKEDEWVTVIATRDLREGTLTINDEEEVRGMSPGATRGLNLRTPLYVGGFDKERVTVSPFVDVTAGFNGCISEVEVGDAKVDMVNALIDSANVDDCGGHAPCQQKPCLNNGKCHETGPSPNDYFCTCESGFTGVHCEEEDDICNVITPCLNGGTCLGTGTSYRCRCPLGFAGKICDQRVEISYRANFQGDSYLELDRELLPHKSSTISEVIHITFETSEPNGLILWHGQTPDTNGKGQDYLALAIVDGYLVFSYELGSGPSKIRSSVIVHDSRPHRVILKRMGREGSLELDEAVKEYGESEGILQMLNTKGNIYFGGTPNAALMTAGQFTDGFIGCISDVDIQSSGPLNLMEKSLSGSNVLPCDSSGNEDYLELDTSDNTIPK